MYEYCNGKELWHCQRKIVQLYWASFSVYHAKLSTILFAKWKVQYAEIVVVRMFHLQQLLIVKFNTFVNTFFFLYWYI